ncbi:hypothetical protein LT493_24005 [Streptomyces tricolor]|nr:hypothetical protein [Streptomyces tricolor]
MPPATACGPRGDASGHGARAAHAGPATPRRTRSSAVYPVTPGRRPAAAPGRPAESCRRTTGPPGDEVRAPAGLQLMPWVFRTGPRAGWARPDS